MSTPRVSVIVPTYNYGAYISEALRSVAAQTFQDWECLVIDDASTDDTRELVAKVVGSDPRFRYLCLERNSGVSATRNRGLKETRGEFIQMLDADDVIAPGKLEGHVRFLDANPDVAVVYSDFFHFTDKPNFTSTGEYRNDEQLTGTGDPVLRRLLRSNVFRLNSIVVRTAVMNELGGFREEFRAVEDWDLWLRLAANGKQFHFLADPACIVGVRVNPKGLSKDVRGMRRYHLPVLQHLWATSSLSPGTALALLVRYTDFLLEAMLAKREHVIILPDRKTAFLLRVVPLACSALPFWLLSRPWRSHR